MIYKQFALKFIRGFLATLLLLPSVQLVADESDIAIVELYKGFKSINVPLPLPTRLEGEGESLEEIRTLPFHSDLYKKSLEPSSKVYWYKFFIYGKGIQNTQEVKLSIGTHIVGSVDIYLSRKNKKEDYYSLGAKSLSKIETRYEGQTLSLAIQPNETIEVFVRAESDGPKLLPLTVQSLEEFQNDTQSMYFYWGAVIAFFLALSIYNFIIFIGHPGREYAWYVTFIFFSFVTFSLLDGFGLVVWPIQIHLWFLENITALNFALFLSLFMFSKYFLQSNKLAILPELGTKIFERALIVGIIASFFFKEYTLFPIFALVQAILGGVILFGCIKGIKLKRIEVNVFAVGNFCLAAGAFIGVQTYTGVFEPNFITLHGYFIGISLQLLCFGFALANRLETVEIEKVEAALINSENKLLNRSYLFANFNKVFGELHRTHKRLAGVLIDLHGGDSIIGLSGVETVEKAYSVVALRINDISDQDELIVKLPLDEGFRDSFAGLSLSANQFLVLIRDDGNLEAEIQKLHEILSLPLYLSGLELRFNVTMSFLSIKNNKASVEEMLRQLQVTLVEAKHKGCHWLKYSSEFDSLYQTQLNMVHELRSAISSHELKVELQPQFDIQTGALIGAEALMRWRSKKYGFVSPGVFIPLAEKSGQVFDITYSLLHQVYNWVHTNQPNIHVSVNLSVLDLENKRLLPTFDEMKQKYGDYGHKIVLEITESEEIENTEETLMVIEELRSRGFSIAIDDFGTGYSSMMYISQLKAEELKIDRAFIQGINLSFANQTIVKAIINIADALNARTVAEGIENEEELNTLVRLGVDCGQGFFWNKSISMEEFRETYLKPPAQESLL